MLELLTSGAAGAALLKVLGLLLEQLFAACGRSFDAWLEAKRNERAQRDLGRAETTAMINRSTADAACRANDLAVNRPDVGSVVAGMQRGDLF